MQEGSGLGVLRVEAINVLHLCLILSCAIKCFLQAASRQVLAFPRSFSLLLSIQTALPRRWADHALLNGQTRASIESLRSRALTTLRSIRGLLRLSFLLPADAG